MKIKLVSIFVIVSLVLSGCLFLPPPPGGQAPPNGQNQPPVGGEAGQGLPPANQGGDASAPSVPQPTVASSDVVVSDAPHTSNVDLTRLVLGDGKYSTSPQVGYEFMCMTQFNGGGPSGTGNWINGDGTWDATKKVVVDGSVTWPHSFTITVQGDQRVFTGNDLPNHTTGTFPVASSDDAYAIDRNPNSIQAQTISFSLPANPVVAAQPGCVGGEVGIMLSGVVLFNAFDAAGRDALAHEVQDGCDGHPQKDGLYHYHSLSNCLQDTSSGHSALMGYAFDGFGIYGYHGENGAELTNADLDECHGHTHVIEWDGQFVDMYHYHATHEFPYVVGCFKGTPTVRGPSNGQGGGTQPQGGQPGAGTIPQEAITACSGLTQGASCSMGPNTGTCQVPPNTSQLACVPAGGGAPPP